MRYIDLFSTKIENLYRVKENLNYFSILWHTYPRKLQEQQKYIPILYLGRSFVYGCGEYRWRVVGCDFFQDLFL
jgi:hypothetical protein